jgi:hypothetical protein
MRFSAPLSAILALLAAGTVTACKSHSPSQYISPRVTGRVVDAQTHQPLDDAFVRKVTGAQKSMDQMKGAQQIQLPAPIRTRADGTFVVDSAQALAFFRTVGWYSVTLSYEHAGYQDLIVSYSLSQSTNTPTGEPWVNAGDVPLEPVSK